MDSVLPLLFLLLQLLQTVGATARPDVVDPRCQPSCGNESIPYPFGIGKGCYRDESFEITCQRTEDGSLQPFSGGKGSTLQVFNFSVPRGQVSMYKHLTFECYNKSGVSYNASSGLDLGGTPFVISASRNKFTAIGCNTRAYIRAGTGRVYWSGCMSFCYKYNLDDNATSTPDGPCTGTGCCQTSLPDNLADYESRFDGRGVMDTFWDYNPCSYSFVADAGWFRYNPSYLAGYNFLTEFGRRGVPLALDWVVEKATCQEAKTNRLSYACRSGNSDCYDHKFANGGSIGYTCNCSKGYQGNPYLENGCQDVDECSASDQLSCGEGSYCVNTPGSHTCQCLHGYHREGTSLTVCERDQELPLWIKVVLGIGISIISLLVLCFGLCMASERRKLAEEKRWFFKQNGGLLLYEQLKKSHGGSTFRTFKKDELERATNNFDKSLILGRGGHGTVYRGTLEGGRVVAIKKAKTIDESQREEFVKEILILSQINHTHVVKLHGCCLEVEVPMLVYEFVFNGTLTSYIHGRNPIPLDTRLRIAAESAEALAYLHSSASPPILHRDVKSSNILLGENHGAKVSDFGASSMLAIDRTQLSTVIQGTLGYLDPECMQTYVFTEKSDVYSFGVVLLELLTRKQAIYNQGSEAKNLAFSFVSRFKEGRLTEFFDVQLVNEGHEEIVLEVAELAKGCLSARGEERPTMKEVAEQLRRLMKFVQSPLGPRRDTEELESLLGESSSYSGADTPGSYGLGNHSVLSVECGR